MPDPPNGYELVEKIGEGGQGVVYKARQVATGRTVAAKRLFGGPSSNSDRFEREIHVLSTFSHPAIVSIVAADRSSDQRWLIMDLIDGAQIDLWAAALPSSPDSVRAILSTFIEICDAVQHAHSRGVIHRDIKPSNILIDSESHPRILDFGIAKIIDDRAFATHTTTGSFLGTLGYAAPEQLVVSSDQTTPDIRVDIYSLGAVLYKVLTKLDPLTAIAGANPTVAQSFKIATDQHSPPRPSIYNQYTSRDLDAVLLKALHPDPSCRYSTVDAFRADLLHLLTNRPVSAQPPTLRYLTRMFVRRQKVAVTVAGVAFLLILSLTVFLAILTLRLSNKSQDLIRSAADARDQKQSALDLAEQRKQVAQVLSTLVESLTSGYSRESSPEALDAKLRAAISKIDSGALSGDIDAEILLRGRIRATLRERGMTKDALVQGMKHLELVSAKHGPRSRRAASSLIFLTSIYDDLGDYPAAENAARQAIEIDLSLKEPGTTPNSGYLANLASVLHAQGKYHEAELLYRQRLADALARPSTPSQVISRAKRNIGLELLFQNKLEEAEQFTLAAIKDFTLPLPNDGDTEDSLLRSRRNLALIRLRQGRLQEAESIQRQVVAGMANLHGSRHFNLLQERAHLAEILLAFGNTHPTYFAEGLALIDATEALYIGRVEPTSEHLVHLRKLKLAHTIR